MSVLNPDLMNCCRVCRSPNQDGDYQCLFATTGERENDNINLSEAGVLYEKLLDISLNERNCYPKFVCNSCLLQMKLFMKLKDKALKTLEYFQSIYDEVIANTIDPIEKETLNCNYQSNEKSISSNERQDYDDVLEEYQLREFEVYKETEANEYGENIVEEIDKTQTVYDNTNYGSAAVDLDNKLTADNSYNEEHLEQDRLYTERQITDSIAVNIETSLEEDMKLESDTLDHTFLPEIETNEKVIQTPKSEEHFSHIKLEPILDKNDYVTEIYELIDEDCDMRETYLQKQEITEDADHNSLSEANTETSSTYNDVEYLLEDELEDLEDEATLVEIRNAVKRRRLNKGCKSRTYKCLTCQLEFKDLQAYKLHRIESHDESFSCNTCSKEFKTITALQKHTKSQHNDEPAFQCNICHKAFNQKVHFQYHMNHHNNIRNYKCDICEKAFIAKADLKTHLRLHTGERPYVCNVCGKDYLMMEHLKAHFLTHTEQSFPCEVCNKQFATHKTLRLHVRTIHEDEPRFKCTFCLKTFRRKHHLEYHLKSHEKNVKNFEVSGEISNEADMIEEDIVEESIDDPGFIFLT